MKKTQQLNKRIYELHAAVCKTLSHPKRLEIIDILRDKNEMGVSQLAETLGITKANVSQHLSLMRQQNIVKTRRDGVAILYSLANLKILVAYDALRKVLKEQLKSQGKLLGKF